MTTPTVKHGDTIAVWFSCGAASAVAAKKTIEKYGEIATIRIINNPVVEEHHDNLRFLEDVSGWLGVKIELCRNDKYPSASAEKVWRDRRYMAGINGAPCTLELKKNARKQWEAKNHADHHVLGFTYEEKARHDRFVKFERPILPVLIDEKITKDDCYEIIHRAGLELPEIYRVGFPNANCIGCPKASSPTYWNLVREAFPMVFAERARFADEIGAKLVKVKGERIPLSELPPDAKGNKLKSADFECGIFCEEIE